MQNGSRYLILFLLFGTIIPSVVFGQEKIRLRVASWAGAEELRLEQEILEGFMAENPTIEVVHEAIPGSYKEKILASIASGTVADVFLLDSPIIPALVNRKVLHDFTPFLKANQVNLNNFFPNVLQTFQREDKIYALPKGFTPIVLFYNKKLFREAGIPYPTNEWTWEEYLEIAQQLTRDTNGDAIPDQFGTVFLNKLFLWQPWIWMNQGDIVNPEGTLATNYFNSPKTQEAFQFLLELQTKYRVTPSSAVAADSESASQVARALFFSNRVGMITSGHWQLLSLIEPIQDGTLDIGVVALPTPKIGTHTTVNYASGWCVSKLTQHPEVAMKLAVYLSSEKASMIRSQSGIEIPGNISVAEKLVEQDTLGFERVFFEEAQAGRSSWGTVIDEFSRIEQLTEEAIDKVLLGGESLEKALTDGAKKIDLHLERVATLEKDAVSLRGNREVIYFLIWITILSLIVALLGLIKMKGIRRQNQLRAYVFLFPSFVVLLVFIFTPVIFSLYLSFHQWNIISSSKPFVGFENFLRLFQDVAFWNAFKNTLIYTLHVPIGMILSLGIAVLLNQKIKGVSFFRAIYFLPSISSFVAVALLWKWLLHPEFGIFNYLLNSIGLPTLLWLNDAQTALLSVMMLSIWMGIGYQMVIFLAGLQSIPQELYEVATIDGASNIKQFFSITVPLLRPTTFFVLVTSMIGSFQVFSLVFVMTKGGPLRSTDVVVYHIYQNAWDYLQMGYASAMSWVLFIVIMGITWLQFSFIKQKEV